MSQLQTITLETFAQAWDLRFIKEYRASDVNQLLSAVATEKIIDFLENYSTPKETIFGAFLGNYISGNLLYNFIVEYLLVRNKIKSRCLRVSLSNLESLQSLHSKLDLLLIDHVELNNEIGSKKFELIRVLDRLVAKETGVIILNIPRKEELDLLPDSIYDLLSVSSLNIIVEKYVNK